MLRVALFYLVAALVLTPSLADQLPLSPASIATYHQTAGGPSLNNEEWDLNKLPDPDDTDHLVFETVYSLLQQWPNTRMRNGHNIVLGTIPKGTLLYHGRTTKALPSGPDWVAMDPEHSYLFCRTLPRHFQPACWHLTLATTRSLKVVYFDGSSSVKLPYGSMDSQDLIIWGGISNHELWDETERIRRLCEWGKDFGVDGFVRMEMDFEVMLCDFTAGVNVVSFANLVSQWAIRPVIPDSVPLEVLNAASWHGRFPGETRIQLDLAGLVSFYDTQLVPSLVDVRAGQERWDHRVGNISSEDLSAVKSRLETILARPAGVSSGIDWRTLIQVIVDRFAGRLELTRHLLDSPATDGNVIYLANQTQTQLGVMLMPYLLFTATPTYRLDKEDLRWTTPIYEGCATTHTRFVESDLVGSMTDSEKLLLRAVRGTEREICRVATKMWAGGVFAGVDRSSRDPPDVVGVKRLWGAWKDDLDGLVRWLDWSAWVKCSPACGPEEMCYLPTWPLFVPPSDRVPPPSDVDFRTGVSQRIAKQVWHVVKPESEDWIRPRPRCVGRINPYDI